MSRLYYMVVGFNVRESELKRLIEEGVELRSDVHDWTFEDLWRADHHGTAMVDHTLGVWDSPDRIRL